MSVAINFEGFPNGKVCLLQKGLYGLSESPGIWHELLLKYLKSIRFGAMEFEPCVFFGKGVKIVSNVDDLLVMVEDELTLNSIKIKLENELSENDMGLAVDVLCMKVVRENGYIEFLQRNYCNALVRNMAFGGTFDTKLACDPAVELINVVEETALIIIFNTEVIGSIWNISMHTTPDIDEATSMVARHVESQNIKHPKSAIKMIIFFNSAA